MKIIDCPGGLEQVECPRCNSEDVNIYDGETNPLHTTYDYQCLDCKVSFAVVLKPDHIVVY